MDFIEINNIKGICNVYQPKYKNSNASGMGDFIRGSYFMLEFCEKYNINYKIIFNSIISNFLINNNNSDNDTTDCKFENIELFQNSNLKEIKKSKNGIISYPILDRENIIRDFVEYLKKSYVYNDYIYIYSISFPNEKISDKNKSIMQNILQPTNEIKNTLNNCLKNLNLDFKNYLVFHIRSGDKFLIDNNTNFNQKYLFDVKKIIETTISNNLIKNKNTKIKSRAKYLIIADNNKIKILLKKYFPEIKIFLPEITHSGEGVEINEIKIKNTLIDFYLLSFANKIISIASNLHGSGFSYWCALTYNVPYICYYVE